MRRLAIRMSLMASLVVASGCSSNLSRFDVVNVLGHKPSASNQITRAETADQGSGDSSTIYGPGGHSLSRVTVGGYYLRRADARVAGGSSASAGLHGNPKATR